MQLKIALFSAFPQELKEVVRNIGSTKLTKMNACEISRAEYLTHEILVTLTGIGIRNAENALKYILREHMPDMVVSIGFAGALFEGARIGEVIWASNAVFIDGEGVQIIDLNDGREVFDRLADTIGIREGSVVTLGEWKKKAEVKKMIPEGLFSPVCDMETFILSKLSLENGIRFFAFRAITDRTEEEIPPEMLGVSDEHGIYSLYRALGLLIRRPALIPESIKLGAHSRIAAKSLWQAVSAFVRLL